MSVKAAAAAADLQHCLLLFDVANKKNTQKEINEEACVCKTTLTQVGAWENDVADTVNKEM